MNYSPFKDFKLATERLIPCYLKVIIILMLYGRHKMSYEAIEYLRRMGLVT